MKKNIWLFLCFLIVLSIIIATILIVAYTRSQVGLKDITSDFRKNLPGKFIELKDGVVSYDLKGPEHGPKIVLVHGLTIPKFVWSQNIDMLVSNGYRILAYDIYGRGLSDRPKKQHSPDLFSRQLLNLLDKLDFKEPVTLVGNSLGGGIVIDFASKHPERVEKIIQIAPVGYIPEHSLADEFIVKHKYVGNFLMTIFGQDKILDSVKKDLEKEGGPKNIINLLEEQSSYRGYIQAVLSTIRHFPMHDLSKEYKAVGRLTIPIFTIWGTNDQIVPYETKDKLKRDLPRAKIFPIEGGTHSIVYTRSEEVNKILLDILKKNKS